MYELVSLVNEGCADLSDSQSSGGRNGGKGTAVRARRRKPDKWPGVGNDDRLPVIANHHLAGSQVVPSLESLSTTPKAASSSRIRSASAKFFALRASAGWLARWL